MLVLVRTIPGKNTVLGYLYFNGVLLCNTLENIKKKIPAGCYNLELNVSAKFTKKRGTNTILPIIYNEEVPASRGIRIHAGNTYKDTTGCILVGEAGGKPCDEDFSLKANSRQYENDLVAFIRLTESHDLVITEK